ncbi:hypothetical protein D3C81_1925520 [compost metagenome]
MQGLVGVPIKAFGQVGAVQLGALVQAVGQLQIRHRAGPQQVPAVLLGRPMLVAALFLQAACQHEQPAVAEIMAEPGAGQGIDFAGGGEAKQVPEPDQVQVGVGMLRGGVAKISR